MMNDSTKRGERSVSSTWQGLESRSLLALCSPRACSPSDLAPLRDFVYSRCGIRLEPAKLSQMAGAVTVMLARHGISTVEELVRRLSSERNVEASPLWKELAPQITVHETYFFRDQGQLTFFRDQVLPLLIQERGADYRLRILSAGCSTGEEAYTLAMLLDGSPVMLPHWQVEIVGVDIDPAAIAVARKGVYSGFSLRATNPEQLERYFRPQGDGYQVRGHLRKLVRFESGNLFDLPNIVGLHRFDALFCRNVLIYFDRKSQERIVPVFEQVLRPGGSVIIGHSESFMGMDGGLEVVASREGIYYRKAINSAERKEVANG